MSKEIDKFLSLYRTYEGMLRARGVDYREVESEQTGQGNGRMTIMRQMRNYLSHAEDPGFIEISPACIKALENMVKEESLKGDIVKNHLVTPAKGSVKEGTMLSKLVYRLSILAMVGQFEMPVYDDRKRFKGVILLERAAYELHKRGDIPLDESTCGPYGTSYQLVKPNDPAPVDADSRFYCCTRDGSLHTQYMGYVDTGIAGHC